MTIIAAEISAAPHFPHAWRSIESQPVRAVYYAQRLADSDAIEENDELRLVSHPITTE